MHYNLFKIQCEKTIEPSITSLKIGETNFKDSVTDTEIKKHVIASGPCQTVPSGEKQK